jgi:hypothetical protein
VQHSPAQSAGVAAACAAPRRFPQFLRREQAELRSAGRSRSPAENRQEAERPRRSQSRRRRPSSQKYGAAPAAKASRHRESSRPAQPPARTPSPSVAPPGKHWAPKVLPEAVRAPSSPPQRPAVSPLKSASGSVTARVGAQSARSRAQSVSFKDRSEPRTPTTPPSPQAPEEEEEPVHADLAEEEEPVQTDLAYLEEANLDSCEQGFAEAPPHGRATEEVHPADFSDLTGPGEDPPDWEAPEGSEDEGVLALGNRPPRTRGQRAGVKAQRQRLTKAAAVARAVNAEAAEAAVGPLRAPDAAAARSGTRRAPRQGAGIVASCATPRRLPQFLSRKQAELHHAGRSRSPARHWQKASRRHKSSRPSQPLPRAASPSVAPPSTRWRHCSSYRCGCVAPPHCPSYRCGCLGAT